MTLRLLDLFSGIGGFSYAAENLVGGFKTVQFVEREPFCHKILSRHFPGIPIHDDICTFDPVAGSADVVCGGFPCQDISLAGRQAGIKQGTRSGLFYELMRVVRAVGPSFVVLENVAAITADGLATVLGELAEAGFDAEWACIQASDLGACHQRDRWWCVAYPSDPSGARLERHWPSGSAANRLDPAWERYAAQPVLCRGDDGLSGRVDRLKALGNAVVPQVAAIPLARVLELHNGARAFG
jgi:DNA (cytosine-5)-methyltransferase 1